MNYFRQTDLHNYIVAYTQQIRYNKLKLHTLHFYKKNQKHSLVPKTNMKEWE